MAKCSPPWSAPFFASDCSAWRYTTQQQLAQQLKLTRVVLGPIFTSTLHFGPSPITDDLAPRPVPPPPPPSTYTNIAHTGRLERRRRGSTRDTSPVDRDSLRELRTLTPPRLHGERGPPGPGPGFSCTTGRAWGPALLLGGARGCPRPVFLLYVGVASTSSSGTATTAMVTPIITRHIRSTSSRL